MLFCSPIFNQYLFVVVAYISYIDNHINFILINFHVFMNKTIVAEVTVGYTNGQNIGGKNAEN